MTGWADTWMLSSAAKHPNCMLKWMAWMLTPEVQAQVAEYFGEAPANPKACKYLDAGYGSYGIPDFCDRLRRQRPGFYNTIAFWKTPQADCGDERHRAVHRLRRLDPEVDGDQGLTRARPSPVRGR